MFTLIHPGLGALRKLNCFNASFRE